ncbi:MAG: FtsX-like permease family protein [Gemmatimonadota bacterium]
MHSGTERAQISALFQELEQRLGAEPGVDAVSYAVELPGSWHTRKRVESEGVATTRGSGVGHMVQIASVGVNYFDALGARILAGRDFHAADIGSHVVIVNESFVRQVFGGGNAVGRRVRHACQGKRCGLDDWESRDTVGTGNSWYEIVGVVDDIAMSAQPDLLDNGEGGLYHPWQPGDAYGARLALHLRGNVREFVPRFRAIASAVDPSVRLLGVGNLHDSYENNVRIHPQAFYQALGISAIVLLLSVSGIYSIMAFTVTRRTREIGIRVALGGNRRRVLWSIFSRALVQVTLGVMAGAVVSSRFFLGSKPCVRH